MKHAVCRVAAFLAAACFATVASANSCPKTYVDLFPPPGDFEVCIRMEKNPCGVSTCVKRRGKLIDELMQKHEERQRQIGWGDGKSPMTAAPYTNEKGQVGDYAMAQGEKKKLEQNGKADASYFGVCMGQAKMIKSTVITAGNSDCCKSITKVVGTKDAAQAIGRTCN